MPDPTPAGETPAPETPVTPPAAPPAPQVGADGTPFDSARAQTTIEALRTEVRTLKSTKTELDAAKAKLQEIEDAGKSETERATAKAADAEKKLTESQTLLRSMAIRVAVAESATAVGIAPENVRAAIRLLDASTVELDDSGEPKNVEAVLKALVKDFPILAVAATTGVTTTATATRSVPATPKPAGAPGREERIAQAQQEMRARAPIARL